MTHKTLISITAHKIALIDRAASVRVMALVFVSICKLIHYDTALFS